MIKTKRALVVESPTLSNSNDLESIKYTYTIPLLFFSSLFFWQLVPPTGDIDNGLIISQTRKIITTHDTVCLLELATI